MPVRAEMIARMQARIDGFGIESRLGVAVSGDAGRGVPPEMQDGPIDPEGWVRWRVLPSRVSLADVDALERETGARFPALWKAYLLARAHLFDELHARSHRENILWPATPSRHPLRSIRVTIEGCGSLVGSGYVPFATWGDGYGPMCFDMGDGDGEHDDAPIVWLDHERFPHDGAEDRRVVAPLMRPLYPGIEAMLDDVMPFDRAQRASRPERL